MSRKKASKAKCKVVYSSNNSGGGWWLTDDDWKKLEAAGWEVNWVAGSKRLGMKKGETRWLGALATEATRYGLKLMAAVEEWEDITGQRSTAAGCPCCGQPHDFTEYDALGNYVKSGPHTEYSASW